MFLFDIDLENVIVPGWHLPTHSSHAQNNVQFHQCKHQLYSIFLNITQEDGRTIYNNCCTKMCLVINVEMHAISKNFGKLGIFLKWNKWWQVVFLLPVNICTGFIIPTSSIFLLLQILCKGEDPLVSQLCCHCKFVQYLLIRLLQCTNNLLWLLDFLTAMLCILLLDSFQPQAISESWGCFYSLSYQHW